MNIATAALQPCPARSSASAADYWALAKPEINSLISIVTLSGFYLGLPEALLRSKGNDPRLHDTCKATPREYCESFHQESWRIS
jgi:hypothetical protein